MFCRLLVPRYPFTAAYPPCSLVAEGGIGLDFLHKHNFVHNDIKAANILVSSGGPGASSTAKVADLGLAAGERSIPAMLCCIRLILAFGFILRRIGKNIA